MNKNFEASRGGSWPGNTSLAIKVRYWSAEGDEPILRCMNAVVRLHGPCGPSRAFISWLQSQAGQGHLGPGSFPRSTPLVDGP